METFEEAGSTQVSKLVGITKKESLMTLKNQGRKFEKRLR